MRLGIIRATVTDATGQSRVSDVAVELPSPPDPPPAPYNLNWQILSEITGFGSCYALSTNGSRIVVVGSRASGSGGGAAFTYSDDGGLTWAAIQTLPSTSSGEYAFRVAYGNGYFMAGYDNFSATRSELARSADGAAWSVITRPSSIELPEQPRHPNVSFGGGRHCVWGEGTTNVDSTGRTHSYTSDGGSTWEIHGPNPYVKAVPANLSYRLQSAAANNAGTLHVALGGSGGGAFSDWWVSADGLNWTESVEYPNFSVYDVTWDEPAQRFIASGLFFSGTGIGIVQSPDGVNWSPFANNSSANFPQWDPSMADPRSFYYSVVAAQGWLLAVGASGRVGWGYQSTLNHTNLTTLFGVSTTIYGAMIHNGRAYALAVNGKLAYADLPVVDP